MSFVWCKRTGLTEPVGGQFDHRENSTKMVASLGSRQSGLANRISEWVFLQTNLGKLQEPPQLLESLSSNWPQLISESVSHPAPSTCSFETTSGTSKIVCSSGISITKSDGAAGGKTRKYATVHQTEPITFSFVQWGPAPQKHSLVPLVGKKQSENTEMITF